MLLKVHDCPPGYVMMERDLAMPEVARRWYEQEILKLATAHARAGTSDREKIVFIDVRVTVKMTTAVPFDGTLGDALPPQPLPQGGA